MAKFVNGGATRQGRAILIVEEILKILIGHHIGPMTRQAMEFRVEEILAEIEKPKTGDCC